MLRRAAFAAGSLLAGWLSAAPCAAQDRALIPRPQVIESVAGELIVPRTLTVGYEGDGAEARRAAEVWLEWWRSSGGEVVDVSEATDAGPRALLTIRVHGSAQGRAADPWEADESYALRVDARGIDIEAAEPAGAFYALQTLRQLLPVGLETAGAAEWPVRLPGVRIEDGPRFPYRGMHLDVGRHFFPVEFVKRYIDHLARLKFNRFHWHLTEDQGWRIEIDRYPRLTEVGAFRRETAVGRNFDGTGRDPSRFRGDGQRYGGFYTKAEIREVVAYAAARFVTIVPEIEMPGHSLAALASYPELGCTGGPYEVGTRWGVYEDIYCPTERTFEFLEGVLLEVMELFPGRYIHIGGDEAPKSTWRESEAAQEVIRREGLADEAELQSWFIRRIERFLAEHDRRLIGWDEILEGGLAPDATVMSWRGTEGGIEAARMGHDVIMTPTSHAYFDYYQSRDRDSEPLAIGGYLPLETVYAFEPVPSELDASAARYVRGAQGNVWTEYIKTPEHVEYMLFPRILAMSEVTWTSAGLRDWEDFRGRVSGLLPRLEARAVNYRDPARP